MVCRLQVQKDLSQEGGCMAAHAEYCSVYSDVLHDQDKSMLMRKHDLQSVRTEPCMTVHCRCLQLAKF